MTKIQKLTVVVVAVLVTLALILTFLVTPVRANTDVDNLPKVDPDNDRITSTIYNNDRNGQPVQRLDQDGNAVDAHDTDLKFFNGRYWLYGESYDCGYSIKVVGTPYCGFKVYSSTDLERWEYHGYVFDPADWQSACAPPQYGCYGVHVNYNKITHKYVLWFNSYEITANYHVFTGPSPLGPWTEQDAPILTGKIQDPTNDGNHFNRGDSDIAILSDGDAYIVYVDIANKHVVTLEKLNAAYTSGTGEFTTLTGGGREGLSLFSRNGINYVFFAPTCEYCGRKYVFYRASADADPLQNWTTERQIAGSTIPDQQPFDVADLGNGQFLYTGERWVTLHKNQALSSAFYKTLDFNWDGSIRLIQGAPAIHLPLNGIKAPRKFKEGLDQSTVDRFAVPYQDISTRMSRGQGFRASRYGVLSELQIGLYKKGRVSQLNPVNGDIQVRIYAADRTWKPQAGTRPLWIGWISRSQVGSSLKMVSIHPNIPVNWYTNYVVVFGGSNTDGNFGFGYTESSGYGPRSIYKHAGLGAGSWALAPTAQDIMIRTYLN